MLGAATGLGVGMGATALAGGGAVPAGSAPGEVCEQRWLM